MKKLRKYWPIFRINKLFLYILLSFLSLLLPIAILGTLFYNNYSSNMERDFSNKITMNLQSSASTINLYIRTVQETNTLLFSDNTINQLLQPDQLYTPEERTSLSVIPKTIARFENLLSDYVDRIFVIVDEKKVYVREGIDDFQLFFEKIYPFERYEAAYWENQLRSTKMLEILGPSLVGKGEIRKTRSIPVVMRKSVRSHDALMVATLSLDAMYDTLMENAIFPSTGFIILDSNNQLLLSTDDKFIKEGTIDSVSNLIEHHTNSYEKITIQGEKHLVSYYKGDIYGWKYFSVTPISEFKQITNGILQLILAICLTLTVIGIFFSVFFSLRLYNPIRKIRDILVNQDETSNPQMQIDFQDDDFGLISKRINQMMEYNHRYKTGLNELSTDYVDSALYYLFRGGKGSIQNEAKLYELLIKHFGKDVDEYAVCCIMFEFNDIFYQEVQDVERIIIRDKLKNVIWGLLAEHVHSYVMEYSHNLYVSVLQLPTIDGQKQLKLALNQLTATFQYDVRYCTIQVGIGKSYSELDNIDRSFGEAISVLENWHKKGHFQVYDANELPLETVVYSYTLSDENKIINGLKIGDKQYLQDKIVEQVELNQKKGVSPANMTLLITELYNTGKRFVSEKGLPIFQLITEEEDAFMRSSSDHLVDFERRLQVLTAFYENVVNITYMPQDKRMGTLVSTIMAYIEDNYHHDLYLEKIAEEMGTSAKYISKAFKEKTKMNLTDYISHTRISKSKSLLRETNMNIDDIAEQVGIYNRTTFLRLFKKHEGITPSQFRKMGSDEI